MKRHDETSRIPLKAALVFLSLVLVSLTWTSSSAAQTEGQFVSTGNMSTPRASHTATLLHNGQVLIVGGEGISGGRQGLLTTLALPAISSAELYDPDTHTFVPTGDMIGARYSHTATLLNDGKVLIAGGRTDSGELLSSAELYDPDTRTFTRTGDMTVARYSHTATLLNNGKVLIAGGWEPSPPFFGLVSAELYDPLTGTFTATGNMTVGWFSPTATLLPDGQVLLSSGYYGNTAGPNAELYDPFTGTFIHKGTRAGCCSSYWHTASLLPNGTVLLAGGGDADDGLILADAGIYDPVLGTFVPAGVMTARRYLHTANLLSDGTVLIAGFVGSAELYNSSTRSFSYAGNMIEPRYAHTATLLDNGTVLFAGGRMTPSLALTASAELYVPHLSLPALSVADLRFDRATVTAGSSFSASVSGLNLMPQTFFDVRFTAPSGLTDVVLNWQRGIIENHSVPVGTSAGTWTITGVRTHELETDHTAKFLPVLATIKVSP